MARQPILDQKRRVFGYELVYRTFSGDAAGAANADRTGSHVAPESVLPLDIDTLTLGLPAFVDVDRNILLNDAGALPRESAVLELPEDMPVDTDVVDACRSLSAQGFMIALGDYKSGTPAEALLPYARFVKVNLLRASAKSCAALAKQLAPTGVQLIAERVENADLAHEALANGYTFFQGPFFCKPTLADSPLPARRLVYVTLFAALSRPTLTLGELEEIVKRDASLSYYVLRSINSAAFPLRREVHSIGHALTLLGLDRLRKWCTAWAAAGLNTNDTPETVVVALLRARSCELLGASIAGQDAAGEFFLLGLCSLLDAMLNRSLEAIVAELPLAAPVRDALLGKANQHRAILETVMAYESGDWRLAMESADAAGVTVLTLPDVYADALRWIRELPQIAAA